MKDFAELLDRLVYTPSRNGKLRLMTDYFTATPDPDRGWALAALTDGLPFSFPIRRIIVDLMQRRFDEELFRLSRDYVGDTAETVALLWPDPREAVDSPRLSAIVETLTLIDRDALAPQLERWLDGLDAAGRFALLKLLTGAPRVGVSARLVKTAIAGMGAAAVEDIEEVWHGLTPPYSELFQWIEGRGPRPESRGQPVFRPLMLALPLAPEAWAALDLADFACEWKWDGIRVQVAANRDGVRLYSRSGDDISRSFPDLQAAFAADGVFDGELLVMRHGEVAPFNDLQQRLNRRTVTRRMLAEFPAHVRLYDVLELAGKDLRALPFADRRRRLEDWIASTRPQCADLSPLVPVATKADLEALWSETRAGSIEGLMLKRRDGAYVAGRPKGQWFKWKRAPLTADCVLMYAQRGSGKRSSYYSDFTFGAWQATRDGSLELVPVGKAYSGYSDAELLRLDRWVREHTIDRFGPVRSVEPMLVVEVAFDAVQRSARHKSGLAMRFPRIARIRWDKPASEADQVATLIALVDAGQTLTSG